MTNTFLQWLPSFHFVRRVADVAWAVYLWIVTSMFLLLVTTVLLVVLPIVLIILVLGLIFHQGKILIYVKRSTQNRTHYSSAATPKK